MFETIALKFVFESASFLGHAIYDKRKLGFNMDNAIEGAFLSILPLCLYQREKFTDQYEVIQQCPVALCQMCCSTSDFYILAAFFFF